MIEKWEEIPNYENKYWISNYGRIKNKTKIMKPMVATNGYLVACLWKNNKQSKILIHRLVAKIFIENPNNYEEVNHIDENKENNNVNNLQWCSHKYNMNYGNIKNKISKANKNRKVSQKAREKLSINSLNRIWINNGNEEKFIKKYELNNYLDWNLGRKVVV